MDYFRSEKKQDFDLEVVESYFQKSLLNDNTVVLEDYLNAYHELCRFFKLTGPLFAFVAKDLETKIKAIEYHWKKDKLSYFSVQSMVDYEVAHGSTNIKSPHGSGCRTLLRLHRALEFILAFMKRVRESDKDAKTSTIAWEVYYKTLYNHHPWMTQKLAAVAVYALPSKKRVIEIMCKQDYDKVLDLLKKVSDIGDDVYKATHDILEAHDLLHIP